jgi:hypothetical protein
MNKNKALFVLCIFIIAVAFSVVGCAEKNSSDATSQKVKEHPKKVEPPTFAIHVIEPGKLVVLESLEVGYNDSRGGSTNGCSQSFISGLKELAKDYTNIKVEKEIMEEYYDSAITRSLIISVEPKVKKD